MKVVFAMTALLFTTSCSMRSLVTPVATIGGAAAGAIAGPGGAALGAGAGYAGGRIYQLKGENEELVDAITHGDVKAIAAAHLKGELAEHKSGFEKFASGVKTMLYVAGALLLCYLAIPFIYTKRCLRKHTESVTRAPFPIKETKRTTGVGK